MIVINKDRSMTIPADERKIGNAGEFNVEYRMIKLPRYTQDGDDLSVGSIYLYAENSEMNHVELMDIVDETTDDKIVLRWVIAPNLTAIKGEVSINVFAVWSGEDGESTDRWISDSGIFVVGDVPDVGNADNWYVTPETQADVIQRIIRIIVNQINAGDVSVNAYDDAEVRGLIQGNADRINAELGLGDHSPMIDVVKSYYTARTGGYTFTYSMGGTALDKTYESGKIDCSTLIGLGLMGIPFEDSPYSGKPLKKGDQEWAFDLRAHDIRTAAEICEMLTAAGCRLDWTCPETTTVADLKSAGVQNGDIIFFAKDDERCGDRYLKISHVAMIWDIDHAYPIFEASNGSTVVSRSSISVRGQGIVAICRPMMTAQAYKAYVKATDAIHIRRQASAQSEEIASLSDRVGVIEQTGGGTGTGGSGSVVTVNPILTSGTKVAEITVNGAKKEIYAPTPSAQVDTYTKAEIDAKITPHVTDDHINGLIDAKLTPLSQLTTAILEVI